MHISVNVHKGQQIRMLFTFKQTCLTFLRGKMMAFSTETTFAWFLGHTLKLMPHQLRLS
jgi:hypothetical protein